MKSLKKLLDKARPAFEPGGKLHAFHSVFDGFDTFLFTPKETSRSGVHIHDSMDSKRTMIIVIAALLPCLLFGMYNTGYQHWIATGATEFPFWQLFFYGFLAVLPRIAVSYLVGLGIEFTVAAMAQGGDTGGIPGDRHTHPHDMPHRDPAVDDSRGHGIQRDIRQRSVRRHRLQYI